jgi:hypothetical protein
MIVRFSLVLACGALLTFPSLRAEIRVDDPEMAAALEEYAVFASRETKANPPKQATSPIVKAISDFFGLNKECSHEVEKNDG